MLNNRKAEELLLNVAKFTRQYIMIHVIHDKWGSLLVNAGKLVGMFAKKQHLGLTFSVPSNH